MSIKQQIKNCIMDDLFKDLNISPEAALEVLKHKRELDSYISNTLNLRAVEGESIHYLSPKLYKIIGKNFMGLGTQHRSAYKENPFDDSVVKTLFAFKMIVGD